MPVQLPDPVASIALAVAANRKGHATIGAAGSSPWLFPGGQPGQPISGARLTKRLDALGISPRQARSTALFQLAAEVPAAILARTLGISTNVAVTWQRLSAGDWAAYAADVSRRPRSSPSRPRHETQNHKPGNDTADEPNLAAGAGIQTVPITNCAVTLPTADETALDALSRVGGTGLPRSA